MIFPIIKTIIRFFNYLIYYILFIKFIVLFKSIINEIGSNEFLRLKVGISKNSKDIVDYVLGKFSKEEREVLNNSCNVINSVIKDFINDVDVEKLKSRYN